MLSIFTYSYDAVGSRLAAAEANGDLVVVGIANDGALVPLGRLMGCLIKVVRCCPAGA